MPTLTWYINPDPNPPAGFTGAFGQAGIAERCSTDEYTIETQLLPTSATEQRIQLLRRLAAEDPSIDLMSLDPVFTAEFADGRLPRRVPADDQATLSDGVLQGADRRRHLGRPARRRPAVGQHPGPLVPQVDGRGRPGST